MYKRQVEQTVGIHNHIASLDTVDLVYNEMEHTPAFHSIVNEIYRVEACYMVMDADGLFDISDYSPMDEQKVSDIIDYCAELGDVYKRQLAYCLKLRRSKKPSKTAQDQMCIRDRVCSISL